jgi:SET domain-containing protein 6
MPTVSHFPDAGSFQRQSDEFAAWLSQQPGVKLSPKIRISDLRFQGSGRGVGMFALVCTFLVFFLFLSP